MLLFLEILNVGVIYINLEQFMKELSLNLKYVLIQSLHFIINTNSMKTNLLFAAITQLITVILVYKLNDFSKIKSIRSLIA